MMKPLFQMLTSIFILIGCDQIKKDTNGNKVYEYYYPDGHLKKKIIVDSIRREAEYWTFYYPNGNVQKEGRTDNNNSIGTWKFYYENGKISSVTDYKDNKRHGPCKYYWENGRLKGEGNFK